MADDQVPTQPPATGAESPATGAAKTPWWKQWWVDAILAIAAFGIAALIFFW